MTRDSTHENWRRFAPPTDGTDYNHPSELPDPEDGHQAYNIIEGTDVALRVTHHKANQDGIWYIHTLKRGLVMHGDVGIQMDGPGAYDKLKFHIEDDDFLCQWARIEDSPFDDPREGGDD